MTVVMLTELEVAVWGDPLMVKSALAVLVMTVPAGTARAREGIKPRINSRQQATCMDLEPVVNKRAPGACRAGGTVVRPPRRFMFVMIETILDIRQRAAERTDPRPVNLPARKDSIRLLNRLRWPINRLIRV
jgi:hypothetical protein